MNTPRTNSVVRMAVGPMREAAIIKHAVNLELENIAMRQALEKIERHGPIMGSVGDYRQGQLDILEAVSTIAGMSLSEN